MNQKKNIHFILNPISGKGKNLIDEIILQKYFPTQAYNISLKLTTGPGHAADLAQMAIAEKAGLIVVCGGDGTVNEVASTLVKSDIPLGIIPMGSGNGLASNLKIPFQLDKALAVIKHGKIRAIDVGMVNGSYFFSNMGIGFDTALIQRYEQMKRRQLKGYLKALLSTLGSYSSLGNIHLRFNDESVKLDPFMIFVSNSNSMGYGFSLTPEAKLDDGQLDLVIIEKMSKMKLLLLGLLVLIRKINWLKEVRFIKIKALQLKSMSNIRACQIDGCFEPKDVEKLEIDILNSSLQVIVP